VLDDDKLGVTAGAEVTFISTESRSFYYGQEADAAVVPKDLNLQGLYAEVDAQPRPWVAFTAGVRGDRNSALEDRVSPRAALFFSEKDRYGAKLLYAEGFRNPSAYEGFFEDGVDFVANPNISAETIRSFEGVLWDRPRPGLTVRVSAFRWSANHLVEQEPIDTPDGERLQFQNQGGLVSTGAELEASYRDPDGWLGFGGAGYTRVKDDAGETAIGSPPWTGSIGGSTPLLAKRFHLSTEVQLIAPRTTRDPDRDTALWVGWNAVVYVPDLHGFDATLGVRNILGKRAEVPAPEDFDRDDGNTVLAVLPGEGRELYARLGYRY
jgi:outer membrane receptor protein involved in Fe transport